MTANEIFDLNLEPVKSDNEDEEEFVVVFEPPTESTFSQSDEDSDLSDAEAIQNINRLPRRLLRSRAILKGFNNAETQPVPSDARNEIVGPLSTKTSLTEPHKIAMALERNQAPQMPRQAKQVP